MSSRVICVTCLLLCLFIHSCSARSIVTQHVAQGQSSSEPKNKLIRQVTEGQILGEPKQELTEYKSSLRDQWSILRDQAPSSYIFKINSLSLLTKSGKDKFESGVFEAGGYKWRMIFYPNGNKKAGAYIYVSLYVALEDASSLSGDVYAAVKLFAYNQKQNKYLTVQDAPLNRFNAATPVGGSTLFMTQWTFSGLFNEYLVNDNCVLGAEIHVYDHPAKQQEILSMVKINSADGVFTWKIKKFDSDRDQYTSGEFVVGGQTWQLLVYPKGDGEEKGRSLSGFLRLADYQTLRPKEQVFVRGKLRVLGLNSWQRVEKPFYNWLNATVNNWGFRNLVPLKSLSQYLVDGSLTVQVQIEEMSQAKYLP